jgi:hypothetical protein
MSLAQAELRNLSKRQSTIRRRVNSLSQVLADLQNDVRTSPSGDVSADAPATQRRCSQGRSGGSVQVLPDTRGSATDPNYKLRRACRVALLELEEPGTAEDIYSRVMRRGAFHFVKPGSGIASVIRALDTMTRDGEVCLVDGGSCHRWVRMVREEPPLLRLLNWTNSQR